MESYSKWFNTGDYIVRIVGKSDIGRGKIDAKFFKAIVHYIVILPHKFRKLVTLLQQFLHVIILAYSLLKRKKYGYSALK